MWALVDFDPHGISILRTYKYGSQRLDHEEGTKVTGFKWLGIRSKDVLPQTVTTQDHSVNSQGSQSSQGLSSQLSVNGAARRPRTRRTESHQAHRTAPLSAGDRDKAVSVLRDICSTTRLDATGKELRLELQKMLMLNVRAEIQAVDDFGDITNWLDERL